MIHFYPGLSSPCQHFSTWIVFHVFLKATYGKAYFFVWSFKTVFNQVKHQARVTIIFSHVINVGLNGRINVTSMSHICCNIRDAYFHEKHQSWVPSKICISMVLGMVPWNMQCYLFIMNAGIFVMSQQCLSIN